MVALTGQAIHFVHATSKDFRESRMREIRPSGLKRGEAAVIPWHVAAKAQPGKP
jgi:hypothetical protein